MWLTLETVSSVLKPVSTLLCIDVDICVSVCTVDLSLRHKDSSALSAELLLQILFEHIPACNSVDI